MNASPASSLTACEGRGAELRALADGADRACTMLHGAGGSLRGAARTGQLGHHLLFIDLEGVLHVEMVSLCPGDVRMISDHRSRTGQAAHVHLAQLVVAAVHLVHDVHQGRIVLHVLHVMPPSDIGGAVHAARGELRRSGCRAGVRTGRCGGEEAAYYDGHDGQRSSEPMEPETFDEVFSHCIERYLFNQCTIALAVCGLLYTNIKYCQAPSIFVDLGKIRLSLRGARGESSGSILGPLHTAWPGKYPLLSFSLEALDYAPVLLQARREI